MRLCTARPPIKLSSMPRAKRPIAILLLGLLFSSTLPAFAASPWEIVAPDLEQARIAAPSSGLFSSELLLFRTSLSEFRVEAIRAQDYGEKRMPVARLCAASKAVLCINANFFDESGNALGLIVHRGITLQPIHAGGRTLSGIFSVSRDSIKITSRSGFVPARVLEAIQAGPRLLHAHNPVPGIEVSSRSRRSGICIDAKQRLIFYIVSSGLLGLTLPELQTSLRSPAIGCVDALNLDGGGSSQLYLSSRISGAAPDLREISIPGRDDIPVALGLYPQDPS